jgi:RNA polymerase-binding transcription factor
VAKKTTKKSGSTPAKQPAKKVVKAKPVTKSHSVKRAPAKPAPVKPVVKKPVAAKAAPVPAAAQVVETKPAPALKPGKNQAGINSKDLQKFRDLLIAKRRELLGDMDSMEDEALRNSGGANLSNLPIHMADMGTDNYEQEFTLGLVEKDRNLLREINLALSKIHSGAFGICEGTGKPISKPRLEAQPWTRFSIEWARKMEQQRLRR